MSTVHVSAELRGIMLETIVEPFLPDVPSA